MLDLLFGQQLEHTVTFGQCQPQRKRRSFDGFIKIIVPSDGDPSLRMCARVYATEKREAFALNGENREEERCGCLSNFYVSDLEARVDSRFEKGNDNETHRVVVMNFDREIGFAFLLVDHVVS